MRVNVLIACLIFAGIYFGKFSIHHNDYSALVFENLYTFCNLKLKNSKATGNKFNFNLSVVLFLEGEKQLE